MKNLGVFIKSILIPLIVGGIVGIIIFPFMDYNDLIKPFLAPPAILFPIVWSILYILMGVSYGILKSNISIDSTSNIIYYSQLFVNALWPIFYFVFKIRLFSFIWIIILALLVIAMIVNFYKKNKIAGLLQVPYLLWVLFASYLNLFTYILNK